jgi:hypothetical protein
MTEAEYTSRCVRQHKAHTRNRPDGSKVFRMDHNLYDIFYGEGWGVASRFRIIRQRDGSRDILQLNGLHLTESTRQQLLKEFH